MKWSLFGINSVYAENRLNFGIAFRLIWVVKIQFFDSEFRRIRPTSDYWMRVRRHIWLKRECKSTIVCFQAINMAGRHFGVHNTKRYPESQTRMTFCKYANLACSDLLVLRHYSMLILCDFTLKRSFFCLWNESFGIYWCLRPKLIIAIPSSNFFLFTFLSSNSKLFHQHIETGTISISKINNFCFNLTAKHLVKAYTSFMDKLES